MFTQKITKRSVTISSMCKRPQQLLLAHRHKGEVTAKLPRATRSGYTERSQSFAWNASLSKRTATRTCSQVFFSDRGDTCKFICWPHSWSRALSMASDLLFNRQLAPRHPKPSTPLSDSFTLHHIPALILGLLAQLIGKFQKAV